MTHGVSTQQAVAKNVKVDTPRCAMIPEDEIGFQSEPRPDKHALCRLMLLT